MERERYFLIIDSTKELNEFLEDLERRRIKYETDYDTDHKAGILVTVSYEE